MSTSSPSDLIVKFDTPTDQSAVVVPTSASAGGTGRNIRSMKLIVNVDPTI
tara:strand:- start:1119 stop:1271 length:153 start_codon:yes stop_codon:yes gene_type:complete